MRAPGYKMHFKHRIILAMAKHMIVRSYEAFILSGSHTAINRADTNLVGGFILYKKGTYTAVISNFSLNHGDVVFFKGSVFDNLR